MKKLVLKRPRYVNVTCGAVVAKLDNECSFVAPHAPKPAHSHSENVAFPRSPTKFKEKRIITQCNMHVLSQSTCIILHIFYKHTLHKHIEALYKHTLRKYIEAEIAENFCTLLSTSPA